MKKIGNSFFGIIVGLIMLVGGTVLLWWNEGNNVKNIKTTDELSKELINVSSEKIDNDNDGKLVATNGKVEVNGEVNDYLFGIKVTTPHLKRVVEMYQWKEESHTDSNDNTTYSYSKEWSETLIDSSNFKEYGHKNPTSMSYKTENFKASSVKVGSFNLTSDQILDMSADKELLIGNEKPASNMKIDGNYMTTSNNLSNPQVGDIRVSWVYNDWEEVSILAKQKGSSFENYESKVGKSINRVEKGILTGEEMVKIIEKENKLLKWGLRAAGLIIIFIGYLLIMGPISAISSFVPIFGNIVGGIVGIIAFLIGLVHSFIVIAIAWIRFRPVVGISLLAAAIVLFVLAKSLGKKKSA